MKCKVLNGRAPEHLRIAGLKNFLRLPAWRINSRRNGPRLYTKTTPLDENCPDSVGHKQVQYTSERDERSALPCLALARVPATNMHG